MMFSKYSQTKVILFRDSSSDDDIRVKDKYTELLQTEHISVQSIPVLELQFLLTPETIDQLVKVQPKYSAIIFTSKNSVKALNRAATRWIEQPKGNIDDDRQMQERKDTWARFLELPVFVVGKATASVCRSLLYSSGSTAADIRGQDAGKAANVLPQITEFCRDYLIQNNTVPRLLFFCGNQRRDTLPDGILRQGGHKVELTEIVSYTTTGRSSDQVQASLVAALLDKSKLHNGGGGKSVIQHNNNNNNNNDDDKASTTATDHMIVWFVCFSPSGVRVVAPILKAMMMAKKQEKEKEFIVVLQSDSTKTTNRIDFCYRIVAIGETTFSELVMQQGFSKELVVMADEPSAQGVRNAINKWKF